MATCVNAVSLALLDACVPITKNICACSFALSRNQLQESVILYDPTKEEELSSDALFTFIHDQCTREDAGQMLSFDCYGSFSDAQFETTRIESTSVAEHIFQFMGRILNK
jgi:ribonuclease PH